MLGGDTPVAASGLARFESCAELEGWGRDASGSETFEEVGAPLAAAGVESTVAASPDAAVGATAADGAGAVAERESSAPADNSATQAPEGDGTNVVVEGIDEPDLVERLGGDRALVVGGQTLAVVDLGAASIVARTVVPWGAQVTYDADAGVAWAVGTGDSGRVEVARFGVSDSDLTAQGTWSVAGNLVAARRQGGELLVVAADGFDHPVAFDLARGDEDSAAMPDEPMNGMSLPFAGEPVPCDQVLHPAGPAQPVATLLAVLPVNGELTPVRSTEVVGAGSLAHVTAGAAYVATPTWDESTGDQSTGLHRFDLATLTHTGSGLVAGSLLNDFSLSEHDGFLRVAVTVGNGGFGRPIPLEGDGGIGNGGVVFEEPMSEAVGPVSSSAAIEPDQPVADAVVPETIVPGPTVVESEPPVVDPGEPLNEIVVLDTEGSLDQVGRTPRFGLPGETLYGIRFDGTTAYAVTFLQTDPFYVVDLADPANPRVVGDLKLPGFSAYLHPMSATEVVGFGPDESGRASAKLFNVSDPAAPVLVDSVVLGDDSPVTYDHHAFVNLGGGRFAVPATSWGGPLVGSPEDVICGVAGCDEVGRSYQIESQVVVLAMQGGRLVVDQRIAVTAAEPVTRIIPATDGWGLVTTSEVVVVDSDGTPRANLPIA